MDGRVEDLYLGEQQGCGLLLCDSCAIGLVNEDEGKLENLIDGLRKTNGSAQIISKERNTHDTELWLSSFLYLQSTSMNMLFPLSPCRETHGPLVKPDKKRGFEVSE